MFLFFRVSGEGTKWEVGVSCIFIPPLETSGHIPFHASRDLIILENNRSSVYQSMQEFTDNIIQHSTDSTLYDRGYFAKYLDKNIPWETEVLNTFFAADKVSFTENQINASFDFYIKDVYSKQEAEAIKVPSYQANSIKKYTEFKTTVSIPLHKSPFTLKQILNLFIRYFLLGFRVKSDSYEYIRAFLNSKTKEKPLFSMIEEYQEHKKEGNKIIHRLIEKFVDCVQKSRAKLEKKLTKLTTVNHFIFIYCDFVAPSFCGSSKVKLLSCTPFVMHTGRIAYSAIVIEYYPVEKNKLKDLSFQIRNEAGELMDFVSGTTPTALTLHFRKVEGRSSLANL